MGGSGGGSSGGGSSGSVDFPDYMKTFHGRLLDDSGADSPTMSLVDAMNAMFGNSPFTGESAYNPDSALADIDTSISAFSAILAGIDEDVDWVAIYNTVSAGIDGIVEADITADVAAFASEQDDQLVTVTLPRFEAGMRDINAVVSSSFVIGKSNIEGFRDRDVARHSSKLRIAAQSERNSLYVQAANQVLQYTMQKHSWEDSVMKTILEYNRIKIVAKREELDINLDIDESDATWDIGIFQHGANLLAGIGGGTVTADKKKKSQSASVLGGALSGAATGAMIGSMVPGIGTAIGAAGGAILGAASGFL